ncbi:MAG: heavy-metal-associated domain-containing protein [Phycisphaerae bacterium]|nr:heavy-metal-associated domain-containing protein [Phycisphaerae bacterium]
MTRTRTLSVAAALLTMLGAAPFASASAASGVPIVALANVTMTYEVDGMKCDGCSSAIIAKVKKVDGVVDCTVDRTTKIATITAKDDSSRAKIEEAITKLGYKITKKS